MISKNGSQQPIKGNRCTISRLQKAITFLFSPPRSCLYCRQSSQMDTAQKAQIKAMKLLSLFLFIHSLNKIIFLIMQLCLSPILLSFFNEKQLTSLLYFWKLQNINDTAVKCSDCANMQRLIEKYKIMKCSLGVFVFQDTGFLSFISFSFSLCCAFPFLSPSFLLFINLTSLLLFFHWK